MTAIADAKRVLELDAGATKPNGVDGSWFYTLDRGPKMDTYDIGDAATENSVGTIYHEGDAKFVAGMRTLAPALARAVLAAEEAKRKAVDEALERAAAVADANARNFQANRRDHKRAKDKDAYNVANGAAICADDIAAAIRALKVSP